MFSKLLLLQLCAILVYCSTKPIKPCEPTDETCLRKTVHYILTEAVTGDPKLGMVSLDPMYHDVITGNLPTVSYTLTDVTVTGFKDLQVSSARLSNHTSIYVTIDLPTYRMSGKYELNGEFLDMSINGSGKFAIKGTNIKVPIDALKQFYKKDEVVHTKIRGFHLTSEVTGNVVFDADNLFDGNKELADAALKFINSNEKVLTSSWSIPITKANLNKMFDNVNILLTSIPLNYIVKDDPHKNI